MMLLKICLHASETDINKKYFYIDCFFVIINEVICLTLEIKKEALYEKEAPKSC